MSKPSSGHFGGTTSINIKKYRYTSPEKIDIIADRVKNLDLNPHPTKHKQLSRSQFNKINKKIDYRTATKEEYKRKRWHERFMDRKRNGVKQFWVQERTRLLAGKKGTRNWTAEQRNDIINKKTPKFNGKPIEGHHTYSSSQFPHLANKGEVIYPVTRYEHSKRWHGGNWRKSNPGKPMKNEIVEQF